MFICVCFTYSVSQYFYVKGAEPDFWILVAEHKRGGNNNFQRGDQPSRKLYIGLQHKCFHENVLKFFRITLLHLPDQTQKRKIFNNDIELPRDKPRSF